MDSLLYFFNHASANVLILSIMLIIGLHLLFIRWLVNMFLEVKIHHLRRTLRLEMYARFRRLVEEHQKLYGIQDPKFTDYIDLISQPHPPE